MAAVLPANIRSPTIVSAWGRRCPSCHDPLYEPAGRFPRLARPGEAECLVHAGMESVGMCFRCGEQVCEVCRTRWRGQILCANCVDRAMQTHEATPEQARSHRRQALRALLLGSGAWLPGLVGLGVLHLAGSQPPVLLTFVVLLILAADVLVAALGVGHAVAALHVRGEYTPAPRRPGPGRTLRRHASRRGDAVPMAAVGSWQ